MAGKRPISVVIEGEYNDKDVRKAISDLRSLQKDAPVASKQISGFGTALKGMGAAIAGAFTVGAIVDFTKESINAGSALQESISKSTVVFGQQSAAIRAWAKQSTTSMGMSEQAALEAAGTYGNLFQAFGLGQAKAADMSTTLVQLASDLASFNNTSMDDAIEALRSGLSGETEPLKRYGVALNDARMKEQALAMGIYDGVGALNAAQKAQAAYAVVMNDTKLAQGDFARTSDGFANTTRRMAAEVENAKAVIGTAFVKAIQDVSDAFGGADGASSLIKGFGEGSADLVTGLGLVAEKLAQVASGLRNVKDETEQTNTTSPLAPWLQVIPVAGSYLAMLANKGAEARAEQERLAEGMKFASAQALLEGRAVSDAARETVGLATSTDIATQAVKDLDEKFKALKGNLSDQAAIDSYQIALRKINEELAKNSRSLDVSTDAGAKNRKAIMDLFSDAMSAAQAWGNKTGATTTEVDQKFATMTGNIRRQLIDQGFKARDIDKFLGGMDLWDASTRSLIRAAGDAAKQEAKAVAVSKFAGIGVDLAKGLMVGIQSGQVYADAAVREMIRKAEVAARQEADSHSPSRLFAAIGKDLALGLAEGAKDKDALAGMKKAFGDWFTETVDSLRGKLQEAKDAFNSFKSDVASAIYGGIDFSQIAPQFDADGQRVGMTFIEALTKQADQAKTFAVKVKELITAGLSRDALQQVLAAGVTAGTNIANELIAGGATAIATTNDLVSSTQAAADEVGQMAATNWFGAGVASAQQTLAGFREQFGPKGKGRAALGDLMDDLAQSMKRHTTITVTTIHENVYKTVGDYLKGYASGGPVTANNAIVVGEKGPEVFVPSVAGSIIPNHQLGSSGGAGVGGNSYTINVQAGVGDPRAIGQQVVEYIKKFEKANGSVFVAA